MFKWKILFNVFVISFSLTVNAAQEYPVQKKEVLLAFNELVKASRELDMQAYLQLIDAEKFIGLNSNGVNINSISDLQSLIANGFSAVKKVRHLEFPNLKISIINNNIAILVNEFAQVSILNNGDIIKSCGGGTQVWSKESGDWKIVSISASNKLSSCAVNSEDD